MRLFNVFMFGTHMTIVFTSVTDVHTSAEDIGWTLGFRGAATFTESKGLLSCKQLLQNKARNLGSNFYNRLG